MLMMSEEFREAMKAALDYFRVRCEAGQKTVTEAEVGEELERTLGRPDLCGPVLDIWSNADGVIGYAPMVDAYCISSSRVFKHHASFDPPPKIFVTVEDDGTPAPSSSWLSTPLNPGVDGNGSGPNHRTAKRRADAPTAEQRQRFDQAVAAIGPGKKIGDYRRWFRSTDKTGVRDATLLILVRESKEAVNRDGKRNAKRGQRKS